MSCSCARAVLRTHRGVALGQQPRPTLAPRPLPPPLPARGACSTSAGPPTRSRPQRRGRRSPARAGGRRRRARRGARRRRRAGRRAVPRLPPVPRRRVALLHLLLPLRRRSRADHRTAGRPSSGPPTDALVDAGATLSHHHGVGQWHAPWLRRRGGRDRLADARHGRVRTLDPDGILNPHVLLDPEDRLEA